jgi:transposase-like protein
MSDTEASVKVEKNLNGVIKIDAAQIHSHLDSMVRSTVEETLNKLLDEEADRLCNAGRYEHSDL